MRLIDADALLEYYDSNYAHAKEMENGKEPWSHWLNIMARIKNAPTIEPKKGEWIHEGHDAYTNYYRCSCCKHLFGDNSRKHDPYCSHCGAKMIEEQT